MLLRHFDPPAHMTDFNSIPGMREAWHEFVSLSFDYCINIQRSRVLKADKTAGTVQFYNAANFDPGSVVVEQPIPWNAFPKELLRRFGRKRALVEADKLWPLAAYRGRYDPLLPNTIDTSTGWPTDLYFRPHNEYCEWRVDRCPRSGNLLKATFVSEPPEYWQAMFGGPVVYGDLATDSYVFKGDQQKVLSLYRELVGPDVVLEDLLVQKQFDGPGGLYEVGQYNPFNKWNSTHGIVHLSSPPNSLGAEIRLAADTTVLYSDPEGELIVQPDALVCFARFGGPNRNSDPTIGSTVNALARLGAMITLSNPVGLYMDHIDTSGWSLPGGIRIGDCIKPVRGTANMIERLEVAMPEGSGFTLSDITIGGEPLRYGGQIAECITIKLTGAASLFGKVKNNVPAPPEGMCWIDPAFPAELFSRYLPGTVPAFSVEGQSSDNIDDANTNSRSIVLRRNTRSIE